MRFIFTFILLGSLLLISCRNEKKYIIPEKAFKEILVDMHLADGIYMTDYARFTNHTDSINFYNAILEDYGFNRTQFDSTLHFYSVDPVKFNRLYEGVVNELSVLNQQMSQLRRFENDSAINIYKGKTKWNLPIPGNVSRIPFDIEINKETAEYTLSVFARKFKDDQSDNPRITAWIEYSDSSSDKKVIEKFPEINFRASKYFNFFITSLKYTQERKARLRGWVLNNDNKSQIFKRHMEIQMIYIEKKIIEKPVPVKKVTEKKAVEKKAPVKKNSEIKDIEKETDQKLIIKDKK
jgi:hypothetical protein